MEKPLHHIKKQVALYDYERVLGLSRGYTIGSFEITKKSWMNNKSIGDLDLEKEGVRILGIYREVHDEQEYLGTPPHDFKIRVKDKVVAYGREENIAGVATREKGSKGRTERNKAVRLHKKYRAVKKFVEEKLKVASE